MTEFNGFRGVAKPLDDLDLPRLGHRLGVGEDEIHAVMDVEAAGGAWDARGRPKMLFEPHRFWRNLGAGEKRDRAAAAGFAYPSWGERPYPKDSYPRLAEAMAIDETAALKSASWGLGQILGENHAMVGFDTVQEMVLATLDDADRHLEMMVNFILAAKLDDELRAHDWSRFARGYNGPQYARNGYHTKLDAAFRRWRKIRDTPWSPADEIRVPVPTPRPAPIVVDHEAASGETQIALPSTGGTQAPAPIGHNGGPPIEAAPPVTEAPKAPTGGPTSKATGASVGVGIPATLLLLLFKLGVIPAEAANDPETIILLTAVLTAAGAWIGTYLAPRNARAAP